MAVDYFLKIEGVDGEATDDKHKKEIDLESWSWGVTQQGTSSYGGGGGAGKATFNDLSISKKTDASSHRLFLACATGEHFKKAVFTARKAGGQQQEYLKITLTDLLVTSFQESGSGESSDVVPLEQVSLNYSKIEFSYKPQKADGTLDAEKKAGYDLKLNKKV